MWAVHVGQRPLPYLSEPWWPRAACAMAPTDADIVAPAGRRVLLLGVDVSAAPGVPAAPPCGEAMSPRRGDLSTAPFPAASRPPASDSSARGSFVPLKRCGPAVGLTPVARAPAVAAWPLATGES